MSDLRFPPDQHYMIGNFKRAADSQSRRSGPAEEYVTSRNWVFDPAMMQGRPFSFSRSAKVTIII